MPPFAPTAAQHRQLDVVSVASGCVRILVQVNGHCDGLALGAAAHNQRNHAVRYRPWGSTENSHCEVLRAGAIFPLIDLRTACENCW